MLLPANPLPQVPVFALHALGRKAPARARLFIDFVANVLAPLT